MFKSIAGRFFALWGMLCFIATMLLFFPWFLYCRWFLPEPKRTAAFISASRLWMGIYLPMIGCPLKVRGASNFEKGKNYIVVCNHNSLMDVPVTSPGIPGANKTIAKKEFARVPLFGIIYQLGSVLVDRKSEQSRRDGYQQMKAVLEMGLHMCIYPEGTRNKTSEPLKPFKDGAFRLALETGKPVMPALLYHTRGVMPAGKIFFLWPHPLEMHFLPPMSPTSGESVKAFRERVFEVMKTELIAAEKRKN